MEIDTLFSCFLKHFLTKFWCWILRARHHKVGKAGICRYLYNAAHMRRCIHWKVGMACMVTMMFIQKPQLVSVLCAMINDEPVMLLDLSPHLKLRRSHCSPFCQWKHEKLATGSEKVAVTSKWCHNSWMKRFSKNHKTKTFKIPYRTYSQQDKNL